MTNEIKTNSKNFVEFEKKDWSFAGDKGTWAKVKVDEDGNQIALIVKRAAKGTISEAFENEMTDLCSEHGLDWSDVRCGQQAEVEISAETEEVKETEVVEFRTQDGSYDFTFDQMIVDHKDHGRLLISQGWGGDHVNGEQYRWQHGVIAKIHDDDTFAELDKDWNPLTTTIDAVLQGQDKDRPILQWTGDSIYNIATSLTR